MPFAVWLFSYLIGSIPFAYLVTRWAKGMDIRTLGDGNSGARNVYLHVGHEAGIVVGALDIAKGAFAIWLARAFDLDLVAVLLSGLCAVIGHNWSIYLKFQGGQGMAAIIGVFLMLMPVETIVYLALSQACLALTRNWDVSQALGFVTLLGLAIYMQEPLMLIYVIIALLPLIAIKKIVDLPRARALKQGSTNVPSSSGELQNRQHTVN